MNKFKYTVIPAEQYNQMLSMEEEFARKRIEYDDAKPKGEYRDPPSFVRRESKWTCDGIEDVFDGWRWDDPYMHNVKSIKELEIGNEYDIICFPKTCSAGFAFVKETESVIGSK